MHQDIRQDAGHVQDSRRSHGERRIGPQRQHRSKRYTGRRGDREVTRGRFLVNHAGNALVIEVTQTLMKRLNVREIDAVFGIAQPEPHRTVIVESISCEP
jgi:hypothetical protein